VINQLLDSSVISPLLKMASLAGVTATVQLHISRGDDVNACDRKGRTALMMAASRGHIEVCMLLIASGADLLAIDIEKKTALKIATENDRFNIVELLNFHESNIIPLENLSYAENFIEPDLARENTFLTEDDMDFVFWKEATDSTTPLNDEQALVSASIIQRKIALHTPINLDEEWLDIEIDLPEVPH